MKKLIVVATLFVIGLAAWRVQSRSRPEAADREILTNRVWIDHLPRNERDTINVFVLLDKQSVGAFEARSVWRGTFEGFRFEANGDQLRIVFPHTGDKLRVTAKARRCNEREMDYCLDVDGADRGAKRYYSRKGWEIKNVDDEHALVEQIAR